MKVAVFKKFEDLHRRICHQYFATITGSLVIVCTGMTFGWATPSLPKLLAEDSPVPMSPSDGSWLAVMPCIGASFGCMMTAYLVDKIGRKKSILLASPLYFTSWIMTAYADSVLMFNCSRLTSGIADGFAFTAFPMYLGEIADYRVRGMLSSSITVTTVMGFLLISSISSYYDIKEAAIVSTVFPVLHFIFFSFMPESPYFLLMKKDKKKAMDCLMKLRGYDDVTEELDRLERATEEEAAAKGSMWDLFTVKSNRKAVFIVMGARGLQQFCGAMAITFYVTIIFHESKSTLSATSCTNIYFAIQMVCSIICSFLVDRVGRKPLMILSIAGACVSQAVEGIYFYLKDHEDLPIGQYTIIPVVALLCYNITFNVGMGTIPLIILGELFPTSVKAFALCLADIYFGIVVIFVSKIFQYVKDEFGMHVPFLGFSVISALGLIYILICIPETKGKTLEDIQEYFKTGNNKKKISVTKM